MRTFYIMLATAAVAIAAAIVFVLGSNTDHTPPQSSANTTAAATGSSPDCANLTGADKERCLAQRQSAGTR